MENDILESKYYIRATKIYLSSTVAIVGIKCYRNNALKYIENSLDKLVIR